MLALLTPDSPDLEKLRALNNDHARELSFADAPRFAWLVQHACAALTMGGTEAFLLAFDQDAAYDSPNFLWFRARFGRFIYIDRVVTAAAARGRGHATALYQALFAKARAAGHCVVTCEVNAEPPNPVSDAFHAKHGFIQLGSIRREELDKTVRHYAAAI